MFKKTLIALSVGAALGSVNANAVTFDFTPNAWTTEGAELVNNFVAPPITVTLGAEYTKGDLIVFTFNADTKTGEFANSINVALKSNASGGVANTNLGTVTLGRLNSTDRTVTYRVTELSASGSSSISTIGATFDLEAATGSKVLFNGDQIRAAGGLTATYEATTSDSALNLDNTPAAVVVKSGTPSKVTEPSLVSFTTQYAKTYKVATKFDGIIDVTASPERTVFTAGTAVGGSTIASLTADAASIEFVEGTATHPAKTTGVTVNLSGNFSFLQDKDAKTPGIQQADDVLYAQLGSTKVQGKVNAAADSVAFKFATSALGNVDVVFDNKPNTTAVTTTKSKATVIERGTFAADAAVSYAPVNAKYAEADTTSAPIATDYLTSATGDITSKSLATLAAGEFKLNGSNVTVYALPINNPSVRPMLYVTNSGNTPAELSLQATLADGTVVKADDIATIGKSSIVNVSGFVVDALKGAEGNRATVELTLNAPECNIVVSASYNVGGDRLPLETSQTLNGKCKRITE